ncbi:MAG: TrkA family potassium uptake protein [Chloroflexi bacterium]|nr:MAG: TrkA family potassium uptake protein [Chloroflexota bacterium]
MKVVIVGCGRVGSVLAEGFDGAGHEVIVMDRSTSAFERLPGSFGGSAVRGDGTDEDTLRRAGAEGADLFLALTEGDNRNVMSAQLAVEALAAHRVVAKINDPVRAQAYSDLGLATICRTDLMANAVLAYAGLPTSGPRGVVAATGHHIGGEHHATGRDRAARAGQPMEPGSNPTPEQGDSGRPGAAGEGGQAPVDSGPAGEA